MITGTRRSARAVATAAALALVLGIAACSSDDSGDAADAAQDGAKAQARAQAEIEATFDALQQGFTDRDPGAVCDQLTPSAQQQTARDGGSTLETCEDVARQLFEQYGNENLERNAKIVRVRVNGDRALATVKAGQTIELPAPFARTADGWKMDESLIPQSN